MDGEDDREGGMLRAICGTEFVWRMTLCEDTGEGHVFGKLVMDTV